MVWSELPYYQLVIGLGGMQTALLGIISGVPMLVLVMFVPRKFPQLKPWSVVRVGYVFMAAACVSMAFGVRAAELTPIMVVGTLFGGVGVGLVNLAGQQHCCLGRAAERCPTVGRHSGAARNLGLALGSAAMGSVLLIAVNTGLDARIEASGTVGTQDKAALEEVVTPLKATRHFTARAWNPWALRPSRKESC